MATVRRVMKELKEIEDCINNEPSDNHRFINIKSVDDNVFNIEVSFLGPKETPYEEILSTIAINISKEYPNKAPKMDFKNKIYHPNISTSGTICLDILKDQWRPIYTLRTTLMSIISLLSDPNPDSPLNGEAARNYKDSLTGKEYRRKYLKEILTYSAQK
jgi:ubiquitin-protein ligase